MFIKGVEWEIKVKQILFKTTYFKGNFGVQKTKH